MSEGANDTVWVLNSHGVKSSLPRYVAEKFVGKKIGWTYTSADEVPKQKQYPISSEMTEAGVRRRRGAQLSSQGVVEEKTEIVDKGNVEVAKIKTIEEVSREQLVAEAKKLKIKGAHLMKSDKLIEKINAAKEL